MTRGPKPAQKSIPLAAGSGMTYQRINATDDAPSTALAGAVSQTCRCGAGLRLTGDPEEIVTAAVTWLNAHRACAPQAAPPGVISLTTGTGVLPCTTPRPDTSGDGFPWSSLFG